jgi:hypothetical protein
MTTAAQPKFDTAQFEETLVEAGVDKTTARAHREAVVIALNAAAEGFQTKQEATQLENRIEVAIANQTAKIETRMTNLVVTVLSFVTGLVGLAVAIVKLT